MTLVLNLPPALEAEVRTLVAARDADGLRRVLTEALDPAVEALLETPMPATAEDFQQALDTLAHLGQDLPPLPDAAFTREAIYGDHP